MYCKCGCGELAPLAKSTRPKLGHIKGQPVRYIQGHNNHKEPLPKEGTRICIECEELKPLAEYSLYGYNNRRRLICKKCHGIRMKISRNKLDPSIKLFRRLHAQYNISEERFNELMDTQLECCLGCEEHIVDTFTVDHDHSCCPGPKSCGKCIRGLLCRECNIILGVAKDNINTLKNLANYLEKL